MSEDWQQYEAGIVACLVLAFIAWALGSELSAFASVAVAIIIAILWLLELFIDSRKTNKEEA